MYRSVGRSSRALDRTNSVRREHRIRESCDVLAGLYNSNGAVSDESPISLGVHSSFFSGDAWCRVGFSSATKANFLFFPFNSLLPAIVNVFVSHLHLFHTLLSSYSFSPFLITFLHLCLSLSHSNYDLQLVTFLHNII